MNRSHREGDLVRKSTSTIPPALRAALVSKERKTGDFISIEIHKQGDQKIKEKITQFLEKVAKAVAKPKNTKISSSKLNLKVQIVYNKPLLNS
jgi:hypothetical protein